MKQLLLTLACWPLLLPGTKAQEKLSTTGEIPMMAWYSIPPGETTVERYQELKDAGITNQLSGFPDVEAMQKALDVAAKVGIKMVVSCPELKTDPENTVRRFMHHPAVVGYHLMDEPAIGQLPMLAAWAKKIQAVDGKHFCYVNLFPNVVDSVVLGTSNYPQYSLKTAFTKPGTKTLKP